MNAGPHAPAPYGFVEQGRRFVLASPTAMPQASTFLWNRRMLLQLNCRGYTTAQFMQPEPAKYAHAPMLEAKTFMQPEQPYYAHHPGRFCYVKDEDSGLLFSVPHAPVNREADAFAFSVGLGQVAWTVSNNGIEVEMAVALPLDEVAELWTVRVRNRSGRPRRISLYPYFPVGYMSWMNQSGVYRPDLGGIVCASVAPYQKVADWFRQRDFMDRTVLLHERAPDAWEANQAAFEGAGGLHAPSSIAGVEQLAGGDALYETPTAALQYRMRLAADAQEEYRFLFGPARDDAQVAALRERHLSASGFADASAAYARYLEGARGCLRIETPDPWLDDFANHWLPRQVYYHGDSNRLTTDPQTRNYLQDHMGMAYLRPDTARAAFLHALSQQEPSGAMPDGILLVEGAELKYINQVPHTDHCVWLPVCLQAYLDETGDDALLDAPVTDREGSAASVAERIDRAMRWLLAQRDERGLSYIAQGDWCDPMNMVGWKGRGVSGWLSLASAHALNLWAGICERHGRGDRAQAFREGAEAFNAAVNAHLWDGDWYGRGITDDGVAFGVSADPEGRIYLNPQSWAMLSGAADAPRRERLLAAVDAQLVSPSGVAMLDPPYTGMREDVGRLTQKFPGSAENGAVYNHAAAFYLHGLYQAGESDRAWGVLRAMLSGPDLDDCVRRGQLPVFVPNYYRGAWRLHPRTAGRSSQLFNTGTAAWMYRCLVEALFGLRGEGEGLRIAPQLPSHWPRARAWRRFRGAEFEVEIERVDGLAQPRVRVDGQWLDGQVLTAIAPGRRYQVRVELPRAPAPDAAIAAGAGA
ncbi:NdvB protein [Pseudoxanthomonas broegbernensis]|uniref:NdvB protein n=1 Tax=Pseudoxanthomonas broegbernensis TaxID=83619 RepID=A0A7V8GL95_9GAMM|nr:NdvB protein [Pseudoxanthomonas broegbernensis]KAF1685676.1 NdvB protein [Pseudoxanthomonas broegbernensis]MBB6066016.1 cellobionic acid phosphorylase [Pseudoxanthomonas broegbernensis]